MPKLRPTAVEPPRTTVFAVEAVVENNELATVIAEVVNTWLSKRPIVPAFAAPDRDVDASSAPLSV